MSSGDWVEVLILVSLVWANSGVAVIAGSLLLGMSLKTRSPCVFNPDIYRRGMVQIMNYHGRYRETDVVLRVDDKLKFRETMSQFKARYLSRIQSLRN